MPANPPPISLGHPRPGPAARRRALGLDPEVPDEAEGESLTASLSRIPDLEDETNAGEAVAAAGAAAAVADAVAEPVSEPAVIAAPSARQVAPEPQRQPDAPAEDRAPEPAPTTEPAEPVGPRPTPPLWRRIGFAVLVLGCVAAIPALGWLGYQVINDSTDGTFAGGAATPQDPGYEAQVDPTPTAVAIQFDEAGDPNGVTFLSLGGTDGGGSVVFVPLDTEVSEPDFGVDRLRTAYAVVADQPVLARERLASQVGRLMNVGVGEVIDLGDAGWTQLVEPVGPLSIDNPDEVEVDGVVIPSGPTTLQPNQVGPYLGVTLPGEDDLARLSRHEVVWQAWLEAVAAAGIDQAVPGESTAGIGRFARGLAAGPVVYETLPVDEVSTLPPTYRVDDEAVSALVTEQIPAPTAAVPGSRFTVRLLNGVSADAIPAELVRDLVSKGGAVTILGNGPEFGTDETSVVYADPEDERLAEVIAESLGAEGNVRLDREAPDTVDLTIVLGKDILGDESRAGDPGATSPDTVPDGGN